MREDGVLQAFTTLWRRPRNANTNVQRMGAICERSVRDDYTIPTTQRLLSDSTYARVCLGVSHLYRTHVVLDS